MSEDKLRNILIVMVGFRVQEDNSIVYKKLVYKKLLTPNDSKLGAEINKAFHGKKCDFISLRAIERVKP